MIQRSYSILHGRNSRSDIFFLVLIIPKDVLDFIMVHYFYMYSILHSEAVQSRSYLAADCHEETHTYLGILSVGSFLKNNDWRSRR